MENKFDSDVDNSTVFRGIASDGTVAKKFEVGYSDVDKNLRLRPYTALDFCQNTAVFHSDLAGFDLDYFIENERAWIIKDYKHPGLFVRRMKMAISSLKRRADGF